MAISREPTFELVVHLVGEQPLPVLIAIRQVEAARHVLLASPQTRAVAERLRRFGGDVSVRVVEDPYDIDRIIEVVLMLVSDSPQDRTALDVTGGTKMMFAAAYVAARTRDLPCFYIETRPGAELHWLAPHRTEKLQPVLSVDDFIVSAGHAVQDPGVGAGAGGRMGRGALAKKFWEHRPVVAQYQKLFAEWRNEHEGGKQLSVKDLPEFPPDVLATWLPSGSGTLQLGSAKGEFRDALDVAAFMGGGWFEEYCYGLLKPLEQRGAIRDLRRGLRVAWRSEAEADPDATGMQEFDLVFSDGLRLFLLECKACPITQTHIQVLENNARRFGGAMACPVLVSTTPVVGHQKTRAQKSGVAVFAGATVPKKLAERVLGVAPGVVVQDSQEEALLSRRPRATGSRRTDKNTR